MKKPLLIFFLIVLVALLAPMASAQFASGFRDFLRADRDDTTSGELTVLALKSDSNVWVNYDGPEGDGVIYFYENSSPVGANLKWSDGVAAFEFSHKTIVGDFVSNADARAGSNVYVNYNGGDGDAFLYFYEGASETGAHLKWDDVSARFEVSAAFDVTGDITVTGTVDGVDVAATAALFDTNYAQITLATVLGAVDLGGATSFELPNAGANPVTDARGEAHWDTDDSCLEVHDGTASKILAQTTKYFQQVIDNPDNLANDTVMVLCVEPEWAPHGITLKDVGIKTRAVSSYSVDFIEFTQPDNGGVESAIETVATSSSTEAEDDDALTDAAIAAGSIIMVDLPATDVDQLTIWGTFFINPGD